MLFCLLRQPYRRGLAPSAKVRHIVTERVLGDFKITLQSIKVVLRDLRARTLVHVVRKYFSFLLTYCLNAMIHHHILRLILSFDQKA